MIRGPVASIRGGPSGADRGAAKRAPEAEASLAGDDAPWPSPRTWPRADGVGPF